jgi:hypothetical protein
MAHPQTLIYSIIFSCSECLSISARCWPPKGTPPPAIWLSPPTASGTCGSQPPPAAAVAAASQPREQSASRRQRGRNSDRGRSQSHRRGRAQTPHRQEFPNNGICWYHNKFQNRSNRCKNPCNWNGSDARAGNGASSR